MRAENSNPTTPRPKRARHFRLSFLLLGLALIAFSPSALAKENLRLWSNSKGATFEAVLLWFDGKTAFLKEEKQGREFQVPLEKFSDADKKHLREWQAAKKKENLGFEFGYESASYRHPGRSKIVAEDEGTYLIDGKQGGQSLSYTFKPRGAVPPSLLSRKPKLLLYVDDHKHAGTRNTVTVSYGGQIVGKKKGLKKGGYRAIDLTPNFWGNDDNIELEIAVHGSDKLAIRTNGHGFPTRLVIMTR